jgi:hypothetical protein
MFNYLFLVFYTSGSFLLPSGDFSLLKDISCAYHHCKSTEHSDMTPLDFVTDHLLNFDSIFDDHEHGDDQKPHKPFHTYSHIVVTVFQNCPPTIVMITSAHKILSRNSFDLRRQFISQSHLSQVFRPPILV